MQNINHLPITHPDKIYYEKEGITKADVYKYHLLAADHMLPFIKDRPLSLIKCPERGGLKCFFQKHAGNYLPPKVKTVLVNEKKAKREYMFVTSQDGILSLIQNGAMEIHVWNSRQPKVELPDQIVMDFDPSPEISWKTVVEAAFDLKKILDHLKLRSFVKLSGGKGVHVHIPFKRKYSWDQVLNFAHTLALQMAQENSELYTDQIAKAARKDKILVDYLRNSKGATAVAPYGLRIRDVSSVAMPVNWNELKEIPAPNYFTLEKSIKYLQKRRKDPWSRYLETDQKLSLLEH